MVFKQFHFASHPNSNLMGGKGLQNEFELCPPPYIFFKRKKNQKKGYMNHPISIVIESLLHACQRKSKPYLVLQMGKNFFMIIVES